ncbi:hypothetical protein [Actinokineospora inagensis]|uniref:VHL beta domain-containing protein n=1 Tax=Actinokineospora inagensis TaxID=103730 RepID=UPI00040A10EC|nr:hypothetical protein [Actinokineospora inagensis]
MRTPTLVAIIAALATACTSPVPGTPVAPPGTPSTSTSRSELPDRSPPSTDSITITFLNHTAAPIRILWLDFTGTEQLYQTLAPATSYPQQTYVGHIWIARTPTNTELTRFAASPTHLEVVID